MKGFTLLKEFMPGNKVFETRNSGENQLKSVRYKIQAFYDRPDPPPPIGHGSKQGLKMTFACQVAGMPASMLVDTGSTESILTSQFANMAGIKITACKSENNICLPDGSKLPIKGEAKVTLACQRFKQQVKFKVADLALPFQAILGDDWLTAHQAILQYRPNQLQCWKRNRHFVLKAELVAQTEKDKTVSILSAIQAKRAARKGCETKLVIVSHVKNDSSQSKANDGMATLIEDFKDVFANELPEGVPQDRNAFETIPIEPNSEPPFRHMYRLNPQEREEVTKQVTELLKKGLIEPSTSPYGAPILFVTKKDGSLRMVIDYRALNKITIRNRYPLPRIDDLLNQLQGAKYFSSMDLLSGYHQVPLHPSDVPKTTFRTPMGSFQFKVLSMGLTNAPSTFVHVMNNVFTGLLRKSVLVYLDDILVFSKTEEEHLQHVKQVLEVLRNHRLYAKLSKCEFGKKELNFLGHVVSAEGIKVDPKKVEIVNNWPIPNSVHQIRQFLGLANYFRRFVQGYTNLTRPLTRLMNKDVKFSWDEKCQIAFTQLKASLVEAPVLALPDFSTPYKPFDVICDAPGFGIGAVLMQNGRVIAFEGRKLTNVETRYTVGEQELLAVHHALQIWRCYLEGSNCQINVITDHAPNTYLNSQPTLSRRQARWSEYLQRFKINWQYRPGRINVADPISRNPNFLMTLRTSSAVSREVPRKLYAMASSDVSANALKGLTDALKAGYSADENFSNENFIQAHALRKDENLWFKDLMLAVPDITDLRKRCIAIMHNTAYCGHLGGNRTYQAVKQLFWWPGQKQDALQYVKDCGICQRNKHSNTRPHGLLQPLQVPAFRWESVSMDFITQLPQTKHGYDAIMVFVDRLSKMVHFAATTTDVNAEETAKIFRHEVFRLHGMSRQVVSDRDTRFTSHFWRETMALLGVNQALSTAFHPQTDGQTERTNRILEDMLRYYVNPMLNDWDEYLDAVEFAVNNAWQESIKTTPLLLNYGQRPLTPTDIALQTKVPSASKFAKQWQDTVSQTKTMLNGAEQRCIAEEKRQFESDKANEQARQNIQHAQKKQKVQADKRRAHEPLFEIGTMVLLSTKNLRLKNPSSRKLLPLWVGPFEVIERVGKVAYKLRLTSGMRMHNVFHVSLLKEFKSDGKVIPPPIPELIAGELEYEVEQILSYEPKRKRYSIKWLGYGHENNTWEPEKNLQHSAALVQEYWDLVRLRDQRRGTNHRPTEIQTSKTDSLKAGSHARRSKRLQDRIG